MIDGEGSVSRVSKRWSRCVMIYNNDVELIQACQEAYEMLGIRWGISSGIGGRAVKRTFRLTVSNRAGLVKISEEVPIQSPEKQERLRVLVESYSPLPAPSPSREELVRLYVTERLTLRAVGAAFGVSKMVARRWLRQAEIPRRSPAECMRLDHARLNVDQVREIRRRYDAGGIWQRELAEEYGVSRGTITDAIHCKTWADVA